MKRIALLLLLASAACSNTATRGGARGPTIARTATVEPSQPETAGALEGRPDLGQR